MPHHGILSSMMSGGNAVALSLAIETDTSFQVRPVEDHVILFATETDSCLSININKLVTLGLATETDSALLITPFAEIQVSFATDTDSAFSVEGFTQIPLDFGGAKAAVHIDFITPIYWAAGKLRTQQEILRNIGIITASGVEMTDDGFESPLPNAPIGRQVVKDSINTSIVESGGITFYMEIENLEEFSFRSNTYIYMFDGDIRTAPFNPENVVQLWAEGTFRQHFLLNRDGASDSEADTPNAGSGNWPGINSFGCTVGYDRIDNDKMEPINTFGRYLTGVSINGGDLTETDITPGLGTGFANLGAEFGPLTEVALGITTGGFNSDDLKLRKFTVYTVQSPRLLQDLSVANKMPQPRKYSFTDYVLLTSFDGVDAATSTTDDSNEGNTLVFNGNAQLDTAQKKFGTASLLLDGTGDHVTVANVAGFDFNFTDRAFVLDCQIRLANTTQTSKKIFSVADDGTANFSWELEFNAGNLRWRYSFDGTTIDTGFDVASGMVANTWHHLRVERDIHGWMRVFVDGTMLQKHLTLYKIHSSSEDFSIGARSSDGAGSIDGHIDELLVLKGHHITGQDNGFSSPLLAYARLEPKCLIIGQASESDISQPHLYIRLAIETDRTYILKNNVGLSSEFDFGLTLSISKVRNIGFATETDSAFIVTPQIITIKIAIENNSAFTVIENPVRKLIRIATETDTAFIIVPQEFHSVGIATETDTAFLLNHSKLVTLGIATETDIGILLSRNIEIATEIDTAFVIVPREDHPVGLSTETDTAFTVIPQEFHLVGIVTETDTAFLLDHFKGVNVGIATETDSAITAPASTLDFTSFGSSTTAGNPATISSVAIGAADANRHVYVMLMVSHTSNPEVVFSVTIGGVGATKLAEALTGSQQKNIQLWRAAVPTGTTADIVVSDGGYNRYHLSVYRGIGSDLTTSDANTAGQFDTTVTLNVVAETSSLLIWRNQTDSKLTISNATENANITQGSGLDTTHSSHRSTIIEARNFVRSGTASDALGFGAAVGGSAIKTTVTPNKDIPVGLASETDSGFVVVPREDHPVGIASETDSGLQVTTLGGIIPVGIASETDTGFVVVPVKV